jgi:hypothetical protein
MGRVLSGIGKVAGIVSVVALAVGHPEIAAIASAVSSAASPIATDIAIPEARPMTAINMFSSERRAYVATDGAAFNLNTGRIVRLEPKALVFDKLSMVIAIHGFGDVMSLMDSMNDVKPEATQGGFINALPNTLINFRMGQHYPPLSHTRLCAAVYDRIACQPRFFTVQTGLMPDGIADEPYKLHECGAYWTGYAMSAEPESIVHDDPVAGSRRLIEAQRRQTFAHVPGGCGVAGEGGLYTIDRRGVSYRPLIRYPEAVGERADPARAGEVV